MWLKGKTLPFRPWNFFAPVALWFIVCTSLSVNAQSSEPENILTFITTVKESSCSLDLALNLNDDKPVQIPNIPSSNFKKNSLSALTYFSLKVDSEKKSTSCQSFNAINGIAFDAAPNATNMIGNLNNQSVNDSAQNINVELILFNSNWTQQYAVNLLNKETIDFNKIPGWTQDKAANKVTQLNFAVRYTKDASTTEEVTPGLFYVVLPFMLKFN
jgi:type 1 fimbria pilin